MPSMFSFPSEGPDPKVYLTTGELQPYVDPDQPPTKKSPWRQIHDVSFGQSVTLIMPDDLYGSIWERLKVELGKESRQLRYSKVILKLGDVLHGAFFTEYIKKGNVLMLSEGTSGVDNVFSLCEGTLRLELDKESYERAGLQGKSIQSGGRKHIKSRYLIEIDLRQPSMLHGKKGFEHIVWAAKNVLNHSLTWLFCDLNQDSKSPNPITDHHPTTINITNSDSTLHDTLVPSHFSQQQHYQNLTSRLSEDEDFYHELIEWYDLVALQSPRIDINDRVDPYISRYSVPTTGLEDEPTSETLRLIKWNGLIPLVWVIRLLIDLIKYSRVNKSSSTSSDSSQPNEPPSAGGERIWLALTVTSHKTQVVGQVDGYTILLQPRQEEASSEGKRENGGTASNETAENDLEMTDQAREDESGNTQTDSASQQVKQRRTGGFQRFTCFQFVDSG